MFDVVQLSDKKYDYDSCPPLSMKESSRTVLWSQEEKISCEANLTLIIDLCPQDTVGG